MNNKIKYLMSAVACLLMTACEKELPTFHDYNSYTFNGEDVNGGSWKTTLISSPSDVVIPDPSGSQSAEYLGEISNLKNAQATMSSHDRDQINYWTSNPEIRWNEIALELIAKYNLIPGPNDDGTYTLPNAANPAGPPPFPFAHPPYASRALAYLSVAQFDGLIVAWHYKHKFSRNAPYLQDAKVAFAYPENTIPSYPSHDAVIATISKQILSAMFPLEVQYLTELEAAHLSAIALAGGNVQSDIDAGKTIGTEIAKKALQRASSDGMKSAQTPKAVSDSIKNAAFARFGWSWSNQEIPQRPVGLTPLFGKVRLWNVPNVEAVRPGPPPAFGTQEYEESVKILKDYADQVTDENRRIANFWSDGLGTYTPPGHWNSIAAIEVIQHKQNPLRTARTFAYLNMALMDAGIACWDAKYYYHYPRPIQQIEGFKTILGTPNFPAYTSGHSVFSSSAAEVLTYLFPGGGSKFQELAYEAAQSRIYAGIHWKFDASAGLEQGKAVGQFTINVAKVDGAN